MMPSILAMAHAVWGWSPVIILTTIPAPLATLTPSMASVRGGSRMATRPTMVRKGSGALSTTSASMLSEHCSLLNGARATASTRSPLAESRDASSSQYFLLKLPVLPSVSPVTWSLQRGRIRSGAPLTCAMISLPWLWTQNMNLCSEAKGTAAMRGFCSWYSLRLVMPIFMPIVSIDTSVGYPVGSHCFSPLRSPESLHRMQPSNMSRRPLV
mmetsp:Transcript_31680/g.77717  ORF Transcript_31680/g.77717 Transcript_31680/m.77717 type:complete len:212 (+) Transcript_31680:1061-1696(+)